VLRVQLFRRGGDGLHLTAAGRALLPQALEVEAQLLKGFNAVQGLDREATGRVRLSADPMIAHYLLAPVPADFSRLYPDIDIDLSLSFSIDSIGRHETDVSIRHVAEVEDEAVGRRLFPLSLGIYAARDYIERQLPDAGPKGQGLTWISYGEEPSLKAMIAQSPFPQARVRHAIPDPQMHLHMVRAGAGMTFLASWGQHKFTELQRVRGRH
jgi:DNA-binding transcriptional LysR family regulator